MPKDWVATEAPKLLLQIDKFLTALNNAGGQAASGIPAAQFTALQTARADLNTAINDRVAKEAAFRTAVDVQAARQIAAETQLRNLGRAANNALGMTDALRTSAGLTIRDRNPSAAPLPLVKDLTVIGRPNGNNFLDWTGDTGGSLRYLVYVKENKTGEWILVGSVANTDFLHRNAGAGVPRVYRIVAQRGKREGEPGNEASVYS